MKNFGNPDPPPSKTRPAICEIENCDRPHSSLGMCDVHYRRAKKGQPLDAPIRNYGAEVYPAKYLISNGYVRVHFSRTKYEWEHRLVMEEILGRELLPGENVHHKNGNRSDNSPKNLELWSSGQPAGQRVSDKIRWAKELLALYGEDESQYEI